MISYTAVCDLLGCLKDDTPSVLVRIEVRIVPIHCSRNVRLIGRAPCPLPASAVFLCQRLVSSRRDRSRQNLRSGKGNLESGERIEIWAAGSQRESLPDAAPAETALQGVAFW